MTNFHYKKLVSLVVDLEIGDKVMVSGWGPELDDKVHTVEGLRLSTETESGISVKLDSYNHWLDSNWISKVIIHKSENNWKKFEDELPPVDAVTRQVYVFLGHPKWATFFRGMYQHYDTEPLKDRLGIRRGNGRIYDWELMLPTHWMVEPTRPKEE